MRCRQKQATYLQSAFPNQATTVLIDRVALSRGRAEDYGRGQWPVSVPAVAQLLETDLPLDSPVTFLVGENGSGKSTLVEAIAERAGLDAQGGRAGRKYGNNRPRTPLGEMLDLKWTPAGYRWMQQTRLKRKGFFLRAETAFGLMRTVEGVSGYWDAPTSQMSHGEGFLTVFEAMFQEAGVYLLDEPEAALSFQSCLSLVRLFHRLGEAGAQVICSTHSPLLSATPGAAIVQLDETGFTKTTWTELAVVDHWRRYLESPQRYLQHLLED